MTEAEVYKLGFDRGVEFARCGATLDDILECESNDRQFSPFEDLAHQINSQNYSDDLWDQFETGIYDGINSILGN